MRSAPMYNFLLEATLCGSLMILLLLAVRHLLRRRLGSRVIYFAWLLIALRLLMPLSLPNPAMNELRPVRSTNVAVRPIADQLRVRFSDAAVTIAASGAAGGYEAPASGLLLKVASLANRGTLGMWLLMVYGAVTAGVLGYMTCKNASFKKRLRKNRVDALGGMDLMRYKAICKSYKVKPVPVFYVDPLPGPCLVGAFRPFIALPLTLKPGELDQVLAHEVCHQKGRDGLVGILRNVCCAVHWFNPLVWLAAHLMREDCEMACDDRVTARMDESQRLAYANTLVLAASRKRMPALTMVATGMTMKGRHLKSRIAAIVSSKAVRKGAVTAFAVLCTVILALSFATAEMQKPASTPAVQSLERMNVLPVSDRARRVDVSYEESAMAYAWAFFENPFLGNGAIRDVTLAADADGWTATARFTSGEPDAVLHFDAEGVILSYDNLNVMGPSQPSKEPYDFNTLSLPLIDMNTFLERFMYGALPGIGYESLGGREDVTDGKGRYVTFITGNANAYPAHRFVIQSEPALRVLGFALLAEKDLAVYEDAPLPTIPPDGQMTLEAYIDSLLEEKGPFFTWPVEDKAGLAFQLPLLTAKYKENLGDFMRLTEMRAHHFSLPGDVYVGAAEAERIARHALADEFSFTQEEFEKYAMYQSYYVDDPAAPAWEVCFAKEGSIRFTITIGALNGKVLDVYGPGAGRPAKAQAPGTVQYLTDGQALLAARQALHAYLGMEQSLAEELSVSNAQYYGNHPLWAFRGITGPVYDIVFGLKPGQEDYQVLLDAQTGWILAVMDPATIPNG